MEILAIRDNETGKTIELRPLTPDEDKNYETFVEATLTKYPDPRYDVNFAQADSVEAFVASYPRYRMADGRGGGQRVDQSSPG